VVTARTTYVQEIGLVEAARAKEVGDVAIDQAAHALVEAAHQRVADAAPACDLVDDLAAESP
jgi:hypothetical protein